MTKKFEDRLNQILPKITSDDFLAADGLGNEIPYFIFEYPPEEELRLRKHIDFLLEHIDRVSGLTLREGSRKLPHKQQQALKKRYKTRQ